MSELINKNEVIEAEYSVIPERTLGVIVSEIKLIEAETTYAVMSGAVKIGKRLQEAKEQVGHGEWEKWCEENLNYSSSWAAKLMRISEEYGDENSPYLVAISNQHTCADLSVSKALRLLSVPADEVEEFTSEHDVGSMTVKELEAEIKELKKSNEELISGRAQLVEDMNAITAGADEAERARQELAGKLEKAEVQLDKYKQDLKKEKDSAAETVKTAVDAAVADARDEALREARKATQEELDIVKGELTDKAEYIAKLEKQLAQSENEALATHKVKLGILQDTVNDILSNISEMSDEEERKRLRLGVGKFLMALAEGCE